MSETLLNRIRKHEGFRPRIYDDKTGKDLCSSDMVQGKPTIGYGTTIITEEQASIVLQMTIDDITTRIQHFVDFYPTLPMEAQDVLIEMAYQLGIVGLLGFKQFLAAMKKSHWSDAATEMVKSEWFKQTPKRVDELSEIIRNIN